MGTTYRTRDGDMLDNICWRHYGRQSGAVEPVLAANPGLADLGTTYATGVLIDLPNMAVETVSGPVRLWN